MNKTYELCSFCFLGVWEHVQQKRFEYTLFILVNVMSMGDTHTFVHLIFMTIFLRHVI